MGDVSPADAATLADLPIHSFADVPEDMLCCVCMQPNLDNVACCAQGHNACRECADKLRNGRCPQACGPLVKPNGVWMRNVPLNSLVRETQLKCPNVAHGCGVKCRLREMPEHVATCAFRASACPCSNVENDRLVGCTWKGPECALAAHLAEVDHGRYAINLALTHQLQVARLHERFDIIDARFAAGCERDTAADALHEKVDDRLIELKRVLDIVRDHTNKKDGSSVRNQQRHKQMAGQLAELNTEVSTLKAEAEAMNGVRAADATAAEELTGMRAERDELSDLVTLHKDAARAEAARQEACEQSIAVLEVQKEAAIRERDECREAHRRLNDSHKRSRDANDCLQVERKNANRRIHDMHSTLSRMCPNATSRNCPCCECTA